MKLNQLFLACAAALSVSAAVAGEVEVLHYWTSGGEAKSAAELKKIMAAKAHAWKDFPVPGGAGDNAMTVLKSRVVAGNPPSAAQIKGPAIQEWAQVGQLVATGGGQCHEIQRQLCGCPRQRAPRELGVG